MREPNPRKNATPKPSPERGGSKLCHRVSASAYAPFRDARLHVSLPLSSRPKGEISPHPTRRPSANRRHPPLAPLHDPILAFPSDTKPAALPPPTATPWPIEKETHTEHGNEGGNAMAKNRNAELGTPAPPLGPRTGTADPVGNTGVNRSNACAASVVLTSKSVRFRPFSSRSVRVCPSLDEFWTVESSVTRKGSAPAKE